MENIKFSTLYIAAFLEQKMQQATMEEKLNRGLTGTNQKNLVNWNKDLTKPSKFEVAEFLARMGIGSGSNNYMSLSVSPAPIHQAPDLFPPGGVTMWG